MATKAITPPKSKKTAKAPVRASKAVLGKVILREGGGMELSAAVEDRVLYPRALAWNRLLSSDRGRQIDKEKEVRSWRANAHEAILELGLSGGLTKKGVEDFIVAAAASGVVQVEMAWQGESIGWAVRVFPWEALLALATKDERTRIAQEDFVVVRVLSGGDERAISTGAPGFAVTECAEAAGFDYKTERAAIEAALQGTMQTLGAKSLLELEAEVAAKKPRIVHLVLNSAEKGVAVSAKDLEQLKEGIDERLTEDVAETVASHGAEIVVFSSCYTGRRLAPLALAHGAKIAIGFHGEVMDASIPVFFGAFYRAWKKEPDALGALRAGLAANKSQADPNALGTVTLWSAVDLIGKRAAAKPQDETLVEFGIPAAGGAIKPADAKAALPVNCDLEDALNYSVLHNSRGGLFKGFTVTKIREGVMDPLEVTVRLDTGLDRPAECHFFVDLPEEAPRQQDLAASVALPLGSQLLRQRGETLLATVEIAIKCGAVQVFHLLKSIKLLPCDEWRDDTSGRHFLPSFVFPRDPAVRDILSASQPFLRALCDQPTAGFDGYQGGFGSNPDEGVALQTRAIWAALQHTLRLDYVNPPPSYTNASQRLRTPEEILRARRGTCIELALLLASCWEHVGIFPVIFLTSGHAFAGYWTSESARVGFIEGLTKMPKHAKATGKVTQEKVLGGGREKNASEPWMFAEPHHLAGIRAAVLKGELVPVEATYIPLQRSFTDAVSESRQLLADLRGPEEFDGMIDVQTAREKGVTPLAIITQGTVA